MLFKIVILATYIFEEGPWPAPITEHCVGVDFGPNTACLIHRVTRGRGYRDACVGLPKPTFWQRNLSSLKMGSNYTSAEIRWFRRRRYKYPTVRPGCNPRGDRANKS